MRPAFRFLGTNLVVPLELPLRSLESYPLQLPPHGVCMVCYARTFMDGLGTGGGAGGGWGAHPQAGQPLAGGRGRGGDDVRGGQRAAARH